MAYRHFALLSWLLLGPGCVPFLVPPMRGELGGGAADSSAVTADAPARGTTGTVIARAGVHPLQLVPELAGRAVDVGVGYGVEGAPGTSLVRTGPYAEVAAYPFRGSAGGGRRWRAGVLALGDLSDDPGGPLGDGSVLLAGTTELTGFSSGAFSGKDAAGLAYGEWGIGLFAGPTVRVGAEQTPWAGSAGITARVPMAIGYACCLDADSVALAVEHHEKRHHDKKHRGERRLRREHPSPHTPHKHRQHSH